MLRASEDTLEVWESMREFTPLPFVCTVQRNNQWNLFNPSMRAFCLHFKYIDLLICVLIRCVNTLSVYWLNKQNGFGTYGTCFCEPGF